MLVPHGLPTYCHRYDINACFPTLGSRFASVFVCLFPLLVLCFVRVSYSFLFGATCPSKSFGICFRGEAKLIRMKNSQSAQQPRQASKT